MNEKVVEVVRMFWIVSKCQSRKCEDVNTISRMVSVGTGARDYVLGCRKVCSGMPLHGVCVRIFG